MPNGKFRMSRIYAAGAAMGWTVQQVKATSMWEFWSAWHGYVAANTPKDESKITDKAEMLEWVLRDDDLVTDQLETQTYLWDGSEFVPQGYVVVG